jgi:outer membrane protein assembly factor BamB
MTDDQLLQLLRETPREELSAGEIAELRKRAGQSHALRQALADEIQLEAVLGDALGHVQISLNWIFTRAAVVPRAGGLARLYGWGALLAVVLALVSAGVMIGIGKRDEPTRHIAVAGRQDPNAVNRGEVATPSDAGEESEQPTGVTETNHRRERVAATNPPDDSDVDQRAESQAEAAVPGRTVFEFCFDELALREPPAAIDWNEWLHPLGDGRLIDIGGKSGGVALSGLVELLSVLDEGRVVRMALTDHDRLKVHCWSGTQGVTLDYWESPLCAWAAYAVTRPLDELRPSDYALVATDSGRCRRAGRGTVELRYQDGLLVLSRGDVPLIVAPLSETPDQIVFDGRATLRGLQVVSSRSFPLRVSPRPEEDSERTPPRALDWLRHPLASGECRILAEGGIELNVADTAEGDWAAAHLDELALHEIVYELDDPQPGTGIYLGDEKGQPLCRVGFFPLEGSDPIVRAAQTGFDFSAPDDARTTLALDATEGPPAVAGRHAWLRLVAGFGSVSCWASGDGIHWSLALAPLRGPHRRYSSAGVYCQSGGGKRSIRLLRLETRPPAAIESLAVAALAERAQSFGGASDLVDWQRAVVESRPADVGAEEWWRACAVRTIATCPPPELGNALLLALAAKAVVSDELPAERWKLLDELALFVDTGNEADLAGFVSLYDRLGRALVRQGHRRAYSLLRPLALTAPVATSLDVDLTFDGLARCELFELAYGGDWEALGRTCRAIRFFESGWAPLPPGPNRSGRKRMFDLVEWCERLAAAHEPPADAAEGAGQPADLHPWVEHVGKDGYNLLTEFASALDVRAYRDACRVISNTAVGTCEGLLPDAADPHRFVSLPAAVELAQREHPTLAGLLADEFSPAAIARLRQATADDDVNTVESVANQFLGTGTAAKAERWLGDRALAGGQFTRAFAHFSTALRYAPPAEQGQLAARRRLAAALLGRDVGEAPLESVQLADGLLAADEFERMVAEMRDVVASSALAEAAKPAEAAAPPPAHYELRPWARLDATIVASAAPSPGNVDRLGRELTVVSSPTAVVVASPARIAAYDLADGTCRWSFGLETGSAAVPAGLPTPMQPILAGPRIFARQATAKGPELFALDSARGQLVWRQAAAGPAVGDPLLVENELFAPCVAPTGNGLTELSLVSFDPSSGEVCARYPLARFRAVTGELDCRASVAGELIVITAGGTTMACDLFGRPRWLRRHTWFPSTHDPDEAPCHSPPLIAGELVYVSQGGVGTVECIELATGRLRWQRVLADIDRVVGQATGRLIVRTHSGWVAFDAASGQPVWYRDEPHWLEAVLCGTDGTLLFAETGQASDDHAKVERGARWAWIDACTGRERAICPVAATSNPRIGNPRIGPLFTAGDRLFCIAETNGPGSRGIMELVNAGELP